MVTKARPRKTTHHARVRRGNEEDAQRLRTELVDAALALFAAEGLDAVSMRAVAARVGVSAMTPYRYFADKAALLGGLWQFVLEALCERLEEAIGSERDARARQRKLIDAFLGFWETQPDQYRLVYTMDRATGQAPSAAVTQAPVYARLLALVRGVTDDVAKALGADTARSKLAGDIRFAMMLGYLHATLVNRRYPWTETAELRSAYITQIEGAVERTLLGETTPPATKRPAAKARR